MAMTATDHGSGYDPSKVLHRYTVLVTVDVALAPDEVVVPGSLHDPPIVGTDEVEAGVRNAVDQWAWTIHQGGVLTVEARKGTGWKLHADDQRSAVERRPTPDDEPPF